MVSTNLKLALASAIALTIGIPSAAQAATLYSTTLAGSNEVPPVTTPGSGFGQLTLADDMNSFDVLITFSGLTSNAVAGHVHCCSTTTANSAVAIGFTVPGATAGTITGSYDLTQASTYSSAFLTASGGTVMGARSAFLTGLGGNLAYFNVHTATNPGGEIRGQLAPAIPEPASWAMMVVGLGMVGGSARYRRRRTTLAFG